MVSAYLAHLYRIVEARHDLKCCLTRCRICSIDILTHPRNVDRNDIRCIFGCREADRARRSTARSIAYSRTAEGRSKKRDHNAARATCGTVKSPTPPASAVSPTEAKSKTPALIRYLCVIAGLIEARPVTPDEIIAVLRQHRIAFGDDFAHDRPP